MKRIERYFAEAERHIEAIDEALDELGCVELKEPDTLSKLQRFALEIVIFRFSKLQDLLGTKLFRAYLNAMGFVSEGKSFYEILRELEKEGVVDTDTWSYLRHLRNEIAHEYPEDEKVRMQKAALILNGTKELMEIYRRLREKYDAAYLR
jgi:hypothetical protein